ncbi:DUF6461 domain-containing protein [Kineococcus sp. SYSU DK002]|uniref:DUF6461 domain-containing protein n=1 Tax=Kineococcus sp. SYSU DK002 TaxID=3383123 RepID=UPI003D7DB3CF
MLDATLLVMTSEVPAAELSEQELGEFGRCLTVLQGASAEEALRLLFPRDSTELMSPAEAQAWEAGDGWPDEDGPSVVRQASYAGEWAGWTFVIEPFGFSGVNCDLTSRTPAPSPYISVHWLEGDSSFVYARQGQEVQSFEPVLRGGELARTPPGEVVVLAEEEGLDWQGRPLSSAQALLDRLSGVQWPDVAVLRERARVAIGYSYS